MTQRTLHALVADPHAAEHLVDRLIAAGVTREMIRTIGAGGVGHVGGFAGSMDHDHDADHGHAGSFADGAEHMHGAERDHVGSFADSDDHAHNAERDRVGSFATTDPGARRRAMLQREIIAAGIPADAAATTIAKLDDGAVLVLVDIDPGHGEKVAAVLGSIALR